MVFIFNPLITLIKKELTEMNPFKKSKKVKIRSLLGFNTIFNEL